MPIEAAGGGDAGRVDVSVFPNTLQGNYEVTGVPSSAMLFDPDANGIPLSIRGGIGPAAVVLAAGDGWGPAFGGTGLPRAFSAMPAAQRPSGRKFIVDPLGAAALAGQGVAATPWQYGEVNNAGALIDQFGNALTPAAGFSGPVLRFAWPFPWEVIQAANAVPPTAASLAVRTRMVETAYEIVGRSGDYGTDLDVQAAVTRVGNGNAGRLTVTFAEEDAAPGSLEEFFPQAGTDVPLLGLGAGRAVLFTPDVRNSAAVPLARLRDQTVIDVAPANGRVLNLALPDSDFLAAAGLTGDGDQNLLRVRLERPDRRYSWMLTGYQEEGRILRAHVVVYFNRALSADDEKVFRCHPLIVNGAFDSLAVFPRFVDGAGGLRGHAAAGRGLDAVGHGGPGPRRGPAAVVGPAGHPGLCEPAGRAGRGEPVHAVRAGRGDPRAAEPRGRGRGLPDRPGRGGGRVPAEPAQGAAR